MEFRAARPSERDAVLDLLALWYDEREFFARYNRNDPAFRDELCLIAEDAGRIVGTVQIFPRRINLQGQAVPMGGIGSVFVREDYRHRGLASELMRLAVRTMEREGFEVSLLFAERLTFYNQFGWREVTRNFSVLSSAASLPASPTVELEVFEPARDLATVARLHRDYSGRFNVTVVRNEADWQGNLAFAGNVPGAGCDEYFVLALEYGATRAYARALRFHGVPMVMEYGYEPGSESAVLTLLRNFAEAASGIETSLRLRGDHRKRALLQGESRAGAASVVVTHTEHDQSLEQALTAAGCAPMHYPDNNYMWRVILPERLGERFAMAPAAASEYAFSIFESSRSLFWTADRF